MQTYHHNRPVVVFSVIPVLSLLVAVWAGMLDIALLAARAMFNNNQPSGFTIVVCTIALSLASAVRWHWSKTHRGQLELMRQLTREGEFFPGITWGAACIITATAVGFSVFAAWVFFVAQ